MAGALGVVITTDVPVSGQHAQPVYVDDSLPIVGPSRAIVVTSGEVPQMGGPALAVRLAPAGTPALGPALPVYVVSGSLGNTTPAPVNTVLPAISGLTSLGQTLATTDGTWTGVPTFTYQWKRNGVAIGGATANTYVIVLADVGTTITVTVTATNAGGSTQATSAGAGPIADLVTAGLIARYACNDATSGSGVTTVTDSAGVGPWNLTATGHTWTSTGISFTGVGNTSYARNTSFNPSISATYTITFVVNETTPDSGGSLHYAGGLANGASNRPCMWLGGSFGGDANIAAKSVGLFDGANFASAVANTVTTAVDGGVWREYTAVYDNGAAPKMKIYKDGTLLTAFSSGITGVLAAFDTFIIGSRGDLNAALGLLGTMAYALVYNTALTAANVAANHTSLKSILAPRGITLV